MRYIFLLFACLITASSMGQKRYPPYRTSEVDAIYNVVIQLPAADLYFDMKAIEREIEQHDWSIAGKTSKEVTILKLWLYKYRDTGLVVTPAMLSDQTSPDYAPVKLLSGYVPGLMLQRLLQGRVYKPGSPSLAAQPIEFSQVVLKNEPFVARYDFYFKGERKPFLVTQGIGTPSQEEEEIPVVREMSTADIHIDQETSDKLNRVMFYDYKSTTVGHSMAGVSTQGDTVLYSWDTLPEFKGGSVKFEEYLAARVRFPESAIKAGIYGALVEVAATFMKDGTVRDLVVSKGDPRFHAEAMRLLQESSGMWIPGMAGRKKHNMRCGMELMLRRPSR